MKITWVAYNIERRDGRLYSSAASVRYRLIVPAQALMAMGHDVCILTIGHDSKLEDILKGLAGEVLVFSKLFVETASALGQVSRLTFDLLHAAHGKGMRVIADISDHHFDHPRYGPHFRELVNECDLVVASTPKAADIIRACTPRPIHTIGDPYEGVRLTPRFRPPSRRASGLLSGLVRALVGQDVRPLRLLWFGHGSNLGSVLELVPQLSRLLNRHALELHLVTSSDTGAESLSERFNRDYPSTFRMRYSPWSVATTWRALEECDLVVIPARPDNVEKAVKSPNRVIEGIWAGRFVCANPVPSYQEFEEFAWVGQDVVSGIEWAVNHPQEVMRKLDAGQRYIARRYAPEVLAQQWEAAFTASRLCHSAPPRDGKAVKLNIGCGDKILPGYINVDIAESRANVKPDVLCDLHRLSPFADGSADEVLAVHVIEHFWRWEVVDLLKEWVRVLKPGGRMILECPNLKSACEEFLREPDAKSGPGPEGQRTMWVFYGDPAWRDPLMIHRWGYTPRSLAHVMSEAGLVNIRQEPAQFKLREPRDMRMVGERLA